MPRSFINLLLNTVNSLWSGTSIRHQRSRSSLVPVMACCLFVIKPSLEQTLILASTNSGLKISLKYVADDPIIGSSATYSNEILLWNLNIFIEENAFRIFICKMWAVLFRCKFVRNWLLSFGPANHQVFIQCHSAVGLILMKYKIQIFYSGKFIWKFHVTNGPVQASMSNRMGPWDLTHCPLGDLNVIFGK